MITLPVADVMVIFCPVVFMTGPIVALGSNVIALAVVVLLMTRAFEGVAVPMPTFLVKSRGKSAVEEMFHCDDVALCAAKLLVKFAFPNRSARAS
jgi:hypothetical protein